MRCFNVSYFNFTVEDIEVIDSTIKTRRIIINPICQNEDEENLISPALIELIDDFINTNNITELEISGDNINDDYVLILTGK